MHTDMTASSPLDASNTDLPQPQNAKSVDWRLWCRLCAKEDPQGNISVFFKDEQQNGANTEIAANDVDTTADVSLAVAIQKFFWVEIKREEEDMPKMLCTECLSLITSLVNFSERVVKVQQMFATLGSPELTELTALELHAVRLKYGLLDVEREHVLIQQQLPEVHYFESKPKINEMEERIEEKLMVTAANPLEQEPRIKIKIKKENILEELSCEDPEDDEEDEDYEGENLLNECDDEDGDMEDGASTNKDTEKEDQMPLALRTRTKLDLQKHNEQQKEECTEESPNKRRRRRRVKRKHSKDKEDVYDVEEEKSPENNTSLESLKPDEDYCKGDSFACNDCPRKFKRMQHLRQHTKRAHAKSSQATPLKCSQCSKLLSTRRQLEIHSKIHLPPEQRKVVPCPYCEKKFSSHTLVQTHIKYIHMNERPFICEECGIAVRTNAALKTHMLTHTDYAPFECEVCKKGFKNQIRLKNHMETHDPNKHVCAECGLQLNSRATLNRHLLVHSDEMQHKCDYCGRAFKRAKALKNHLILHTGLKPYSCDFCDRTFANGSNCRSHKKKAHPEELAALEAAGGGRKYTKNIPKLEALKAVTKAADNLAPVVSKHSGRFAFGKKPKHATHEETAQGVSAKSECESQINQEQQQPIPSSSSVMQHPANAATTSLSDEYSSLHSAELASTTPTTPLITPAPLVPAAPIPNIDNIYSHIMKRAAMTSTNHSLTENELVLHIKRPVSQAASCVAIEHDGCTSDMQHQQQSLHSGAPSSVTAMPSRLYTQLMRQNMLQQQEHESQQNPQLHHLQQHQHPHHLQHTHLSHHHHQQLHADDVTASIRSPDSQTSSSHMTDGRASNASVQFYNDIRQNLQGPYI